jgi:hypothetical protein
MNLTYFVRDSRVKQDALRRGGFARINMGNNANVSVSFDGCCSWHKCIPSDGQRYSRNAGDRVQVGIAEVFLNLPGNRSK